MVGEEAEVLVERFEGLRGDAGVNQRDSQSEQSLGAGGVGLEGVAERFGGGPPFLQVAQTDAQVEVRGAVLRLGFRHMGVSRGGGLVVAHFILYVSQGGKQGGIGLSGFNGSFQQLGRDLHLAFEVQGDGLRQRAAGTLLLIALLDGHHAFRHDGPAARLGG